MGNGNRNGTVMGAGGGCGGDSAGGKAAAASFECDVGLGLKVQNTESYPPCTKKITGICPSYHQKQHYHHPYHESNNNNFLSGGSSDYGGYGYNPGCGPQLACVSGIYDAAPSPAVLPRTLLQSSSSSSGGGMTSGKVLFTANQWQELERQTTIYKCMMTSTPVPPELLLPFSSTRPPILAQSNTAGLDLRFSSGSDPEPWRCRRTDGKKWRCSRDVAPDQKYCERHAHKSRPRSRKPVEIQSHTTTSTAAATTTTGNLKNNYTHNPSLLSAYNTNQSFQKPMPQFSNMVSATTYDQPQLRGTEWFMKSGGPTPVSTSTQQFQQLMQSSARLGTKRDKNTSVFQQNYEGEQQPMSFNPYLINGTSDTTGSTAAATRQHLIDAWSRGGTEREGLNGIGNNNYKCSLTLSMQSGGNGIDEDNEIFSMGSSSHVGMIDSDRAGTGTGEVLKSQTQWLNSGSWIGSAPGGPLGEALCLGIASNGKGTSPHGYSNSTTTSSSCEDGVHGLNFIR